MEINGKTVIPYVSSHTGKGKVGLSPSAKSYLGVHEGELLFFSDERAHLKSFEVDLAWLADILEVRKEGQDHKEVVFISEEDYAYFSDDVQTVEEKEPEKEWSPIQEIPYTQTDNGLIVICASSWMSPDIFPVYTVRMDDRTRRALGQTYGVPWVIEGRMFLVQQALIGDIEAIEAYHLPANIVFMNKDSVPPGCKVLSMTPPTIMVADVKTIPPYFASSKVREVIGEDLAKDIEVHVYTHLSRGLERFGARLDHKAWASAVSSHMDNTDAAISEALKLLREDLVKTRDKINATIDRIHSG